MFSLFLFRILNHFPSFAFYFLLSFPFFLFCLFNQYLFFFLTMQVLPSFLAVPEKRKKMSFKANCQEFQSRNLRKPTLKEKKIINKNKINKAFYFSFCFCLFFSLSLSIRDDFEKSIFQCGGVGRKESQVFFLIYKAVDNSFFSSIKSF